MLRYHSIDEGDTVIDVVSSHFSNCHTKYLQYENNEHSGGLSILVDGFIGDHNFTVSVKSSSFFNNTGSDGGNMVIKIRHENQHVPLVSIHIHNCNFTGGYASGHGGGLFLLYSSRTAHIHCTVYNTTFIENTAMYHGGG